jgi:hypothetical protein
MTAYRKTVQNVLTLRKGTAWREGTAKPQNPYRRVCGVFLCARASRRPSMPGAAPTPSLASAFHGCHSSAPMNPTSPPCMSPSEFASWQEANAVCSPRYQAASPL